MKFTLKLSVEVRRSHPESCTPEQLAPVTDATLGLARCGWDHDTRSPAVAAKFGFSQPVSGTGTPGRA